MKRLFLMLLFVNVYFFSSAQCTLPYKSLAQFSNDTTAFITYNFSTRAACYVGKTMQDVINDLGLPVKSCLVSNGIYNASYLDGIYIYLYPDATVRRYLVQKDMHNFIAIGWQSATILRSTFDALRDTSDRYKWTPQIADLFKNMVISEIDIVHGPPTNNTQSGGRFDSSTGDTRQP